MMTREEAIVLFEKQLTAAQVVLDSGFGSNPGENDSLYRRRKEMAEIALSALRPVSREQVEKIRGEWIDIDGETVPVDKYGQTLGWAECSACGQYLTASDEYPCTGHFCPNCGAPMTDEAVDMMLKRMEEIYK